MYLWCPLQATNARSAAKAAESFLSCQTSFLSHSAAFHPGVEGEVGHRESQSLLE